MPPTQASFRRPCRLRPARSSDGTALYAVFFAAVHGGTVTAYSARERNAWAPSPTAPPDWNDRLMGGVTILAESRGRAAGFMTLGHDGHLDLAYVAPDHAGQGIGRALHTAILDRARAQGLSLLDTQASLIARPFFTALGWQTIARQSVIREGVALTNFRMERLL
ncbi:GNAT family N-acetyltransferase [Rhodovulum adriaticum]|uniref:GNAT family acetyltransferase n=1 Tax=Rhodovulum adriaticum TaxID=35804 RepID=A0A4R2NWB3_RHOAD|nr:GNAT family N-acetyltransferase [Rhodovulum adriaticum]TCP26272.1 GNAT family acetyltransferase [Rhodovulum adriaticum]